jgi:hypothetical protein
MFMSTATLVLVLALTGSVAFTVPSHAQVAARRAASILPGRASISPLVARRAAIRITTRMSVPPPPPPSPAEKIVVEESMKKYFDACAKDGKDSPKARIALENYKAALQLQAKVCEPHTTALEQAWRCL